jgi:ubiquinone/menaquinone biosynthesis C-methylase UbiE
LNWHRRYLQQASWTRDLRAYLFEQAHLSATHRVLEVGCGTGAVLRDLAVPDSDPSAQGPSVRRFTFGLDLDTGALSECRTHAPTALLARADALALPYPDQTFDITCCHYLLLWIRDPLTALREMKRVTRNHGQLLALAEPDYSARIDRPPTLAALGEFQNESLRRQGADVALGSHLADLFVQAGINIVETGVIQPRAQAARRSEEDDDEWEVLRGDVEGIVSRQEIRKLERLDAQARQRGERLLYVPTYFTFGQV